MTPAMSSSVLVIDDEPAVSASMAEVASPVAGGEQDSYILVDGRLRPTHNSLGRPIAASDEATANFWQWFGESKMVDAHGRPEVFYHGTPASFSTFSEKYFGRTDNGYHGHGFYFASTRENAEEYGHQVLEVYLRAAHPLDLPEAGTCGHASIYDARDILARLYERQHLVTDRVIPDGYRLAETTLDAYGRVWPRWYVAPNPELYSTDREIYGPEEGSPLAAIIAFNDRRHDVGLSEGWLPGLLKDFGRQTLRLQAQCRGYDALVIRDADFDPGSIDEVVMFAPEQIKSAVGNHGGFSSTSPSIYE